MEVIVFTGDLLGDSIVICGWKKSLRVSQGRAGRVRCPRNSLNYCPFVLLCCLLCLGRSMCLFDVCGSSGQSGGKVEPLLFINIVQIFVEYYCEVTLYCQLDLCVNISVWPNAVGFWKYKNSLIVIQVIVILRN